MNTELIALSNTDIKTIVDVLKRVYVSHHRNRICVFIAGWFAKERISPLSVARIIKLLYDETNDRDPLRERLSAIIYTYKKLSLWSEDIESTFLSQLREWGVEDVYGLDYRPTGAERVTGKSGLFREITYIAGKEEAERIVKSIAGIIKRAKQPRAKSLFELKS